MLTDQLTRETNIDAPIEHVWALLTEPANLAAWWCSGGAEVEPRPGGALVLRFPGHGTTHGRITALEPPHRFAFRWSLYPGEEPGDGNATEVTFTLAPDGDGTLLRVEERGFAGLRGTDADREAHLENNRQGWAATFGALADYARQPLG